MGVFGDFCTLVTFKLTTCREDLISSLRRVNQSLPGELQRQFLECLAFILLNQIVLTWGLHKDLHKGFEVGMLPADVEAELGTGT